MLVELKSGETLNGHLVNCDTWMNLTLREVIQTSPVSAFSQIPARHIYPAHEWTFESLTCVFRMEIGSSDYQSVTSAGIT